MPRSLRRFAALLALCGLLSAQVALAAYICPADAGPLPVATVHTQCAAPDDADPVIDGALCQLHCQVVVSAPSVPAADLAMPAIPPLIVAGTSVRASSRAASADADLPAVLAAAPPVALRYCRLLI